MWNVGWTIHPRFTKLVIDGVIYSHGDSGRGGQDAAFQQARDNFRDRRSTKRTAGSRTMSSTCGCSARIQTGLMRPSTLA